MEESQTSHAEKFELLLERFPHPDRRDHPDPEKRKWKMAEISRETGEALSSPYLSGVRSGKNNKPGMRPLDMIATVIGFPIELWITEPDQWDRILRERGWQVAPAGERRPGAEVDGLPELVRQLFRSITNRRTGKPFTVTEAADRSDGRITVEGIEAMLDGTLTDPSRTQLLALCDAFGVDFSYFSGSAEERPLLDAETAGALRDAHEDRRYRLAEKSFGLSDEKLDLLLLLMDQLDSETGGGRGGPPEGGDTR